MNTYLVAYYGTVVPTFSYAETLPEARSYALILLNSQHCQRSDVLSIVDVADDCVIYYGKRDELIAKFSTIDQPTTVGATTVAGSFWTPLKAMLNWINDRLARPTAG